MKRGNQVLNAAAVKTGRTMARWAAAGMNFADGDHKVAVMAAGNRILAGGAVAADRLGRRFLAEDAASDAPGGYRHGAPADCWCQSAASEIILAAAD